MVIRDKVADHRSRFQAGWAVSGWGSGLQHSSIPGWQPNLTPWGTVNMVPADRLMGGSRAGAHAWQPRSGIPVGEGGRA